MLKTLPPLSSLREFLNEHSDGRRQLINIAQERIGALNARYRAFSHLSPEPLAAIEHPASASVDGQESSALSGAIISVKGNIPVRGLPWTEGSRMYGHRVAHADAAVVAKARAKGAVIIGTTTLSELAMYAVRNEFEPMGLNPWDPGRTAGGSSTGAGVAAALGLAQVNIGTDSGGSIRNPACHCGAVGFMPRIGSLSGEGVTDYAPSLSSIGLIGRTVREVRLAFSELGTGEPARHEAARRLIVPVRLIEQYCDSETIALFEAAASRLRTAGFDLIQHDIASWTSGEAAAGLISLFESKQVLRTLDLELAGRHIQGRLTPESWPDEPSVNKARSDMRAFRQQMTHALNSTGASAVLSPTWPFAAPAMDDEQVLVQGKWVPTDPHRNCFVRAANGAGASALTMPMGLYPSAGVPAGLHLMTTHMDEDAFLGLAEAVESALPALPAPELTD